MPSYSWHDVFTKGGGGPNVATWDGVNGALTLASIANPSASLLTLTGGTALTASHPVLDMSQGWNNAAVTFTGLKLNITNTASTNLSRLVDVQINGSTVFNIAAEGNQAVVAINKAPQFSYELYIKSLDGNADLGFEASDGTLANYFAGAGIWGISNGTYNLMTLGLGLSGVSLSISASSAFTWSSDSNANSTPNAKLYTDGAGIVAQRNGTNAQTLRVYYSYTDASNYERLKIGYNGANISIGHEAAGTGTEARSIRLFTGVGAASYFELDAAGDAYASTAIGVASSLLIKAPSDGVATLFNWNANDFGRLQFGGTTSSFPALKRSAAALQCRLADDSAYAALRSETLTVTQLGSGTPSIVNGANANTGLAFYSGSNFVFIGNGTAMLSSVASSGPLTIELVNGTALGFESGFTGTPDTYLYRDAASILAQRNSTTAQIFRVYNTYTDASNYERGFFSWSSNILAIGAEAAGTGGVRSVQFQIGSGAHYDFLVAGANVCRFDVNGLSVGGGSLTFGRRSATLANGLNSDIATAGLSWMVISGPTGAFSLGGFAASAQVGGTLLVVYNSTAQTMTIVDQDASSTAANRIKTLTGGNVVLRATATSSATFMYDDNVARWILTATN